MKISANIKPIVMKGQNKDMLVDNIINTFSLDFDDSGTLYRVNDNNRVEYFGLVFHKAHLKFKAPDESSRKRNEWTAQIYIIDESLLRAGIRILQHPRCFEIHNV